MIIVLSWYLIWSLAYTHETEKVFRFHWPNLFHFHQFSIIVFLQDLLHLTRGKIGLVQAKNKIFCVYIEKWCSNPIPWQKKWDVYQCIWCCKAFYILASCIQKMKGCNLSGLASQIPSINFLQQNLIDKREKLNKTNF